jgi:hypothetical protein
MNSLLPSGNAKCTCKIIACGARVYGSAYTHMLAISSSKAIKAVPPHTKSKILFKNLHGII